jgi:pyruvate/2-oxoglutarate dehydrogenase complex dihydrolipoamide acyltransferase (E2) component
MLRGFRALLCTALAFTAYAFMPHLAHSVQPGHKAKALHMAEININMPALSSTMKEGKIVSWNKKIGDKVNSGDVLLVVESDKADMDVEAFEGGYLAAIYTPEGKSAPVGSIVAVLVDNAADIGKVGAAPTNAAALPLTPSAPAAKEALSTPSASAGASAPDFEQITMPALSSTMKQGKIVSWSKKVGDKVSSGDVLLVVESDKADMDVESFESGFLASIAVKDGETASVGAPVGYMAKKAADIPAVQEYLKSGGKPAAKPADPAAPEPFMVIPASNNAAPSTGASAPKVVNSGRVSASGYAQQMAKQSGINLATVAPSRPDGYITARDLASGSQHGGGAATPASGSDHEHVPAPGTLNASPSARKLAQEHGVDLAKLRGTGNFGRVLPDDVLKAAGKYVAPKAASSASVTNSAAAGFTASAATGSMSAAAVAAPVQDGLVAMDGMQKAVAKNMEKTLTVPVFRVSR